MRPKRLPKYDDVIFKDFEQAKNARNIIMDILNYAKKNHPGYHFISVRDLLNNLHTSDVKYRVIEGFEPGDQVVEDNKFYGWTKRPGIYEVENGNPSAGYIFEEPVYLF